MGLAARFLSNSPNDPLLVLESLGLLNSLFSTSSPLLFSELFPLVARSLWISSSPCSNSLSTPDLRIVFGAPSGNNTCTVEPEATLVMIPVLLPSLIGGKVAILSSISSTRKLPLRCVDGRRGSSCFSRWHSEARGLSSLLETSLNDESASDKSSAVSLALLSFRKISSFSFAPVS